MTDDMLVREVSNGQWFVLSAILVTFYIVYAIVRPVSIGPYKPIFLDHYLAPVTQFALARAVYMTGSGVRAGYIWLLLHCQNINDDCSLLQQNAWVMLAASFIATVGGLWEIRTLSPTQWRPWSWVGAGVLSLVIPLFYYTTAQWVTFAAPTGATIHGHHNVLLVVLSVVIACMASYVALNLAGRARQSKGAIWIAWLAAAAASFGGGIWSMHFVAMLAFSMPGVPVEYDLELTLLSLVLPIVVVGVGLFSVRKDSSRAAVSGAGALVGIGIATMHYTGMSAMRMPVDLSYDPALFFASIIIAIGASIVALWLAFRLTVTWHKVLAAGVEGIAISGMHYTAMAAANFYRPVLPLPIPAGASVNQEHLAIGVGATTMLILALALAAAAYDRRRE